jgi:hypothetical protein
MRILTALGASMLLAPLSMGVRAAGLPLVISATVDYTQNTLTISGQNFGSHPSVTLDALAFTTQSSASSHFTPGRQSAVGSRQCGSCHVAPTPKGSLVPPM